MNNTKKYFDKILAEKSTMTDLNAWIADSDGADSFLEKINNKSKVSYWERFSWVLASAAGTLNDVFDLFKIDLEAISKKSRFGTDLSYINVAKAFQYGDNLVNIDNEWKYPEQTAADALAAKKIIAFAALQETGDALTLKVARVVGGVQQELDAAQLQAFTAYMNFQKPKGINLTTVSLPPDLMWLQLSVNYDPILLKATGESIASPGTYPAADAVNAYLSSVNTGFKGKFENDKMIDFVQKAHGVKSAYTISTKGKANGGVYGAAFPQSYTSVAGYLKIDSAYPLTTTITYTPDV